MFAFRIALVVIAVAAAAGCAPTPTVQNSQEPTVIEIDERPRTDPYAPLTPAQQRAVADDNPPPSARQNDRDFIVNGGTFGQTNQVPVHATPPASPTVKP